MPLSSYLEQGKSLNSKEEKTSKVKTSDTSSSGPEAESSSSPSSLLLTIEVVFQPLLVQLHLYSLKWGYIKSTSAGQSPCSAVGVKSEPEVGANVTESKRQL